MSRDTPCVGICTTLFDPVCQGCFRTQKEVDNWVFMTPEEKEVTWARIKPLLDAKGEEEAKRIF